MVKGARRAACAPAGGAAAVGQADEDCDSIGVAQRRLGRQARALVADGTLGRARSLLRSFCLGRRTALHRLRLLLCALCNLRLLHVRLAATRHTWSLSHAACHEASENCSICMTCTLLFHSSLRRQRDVNFSGTLQGDFISIAIIVVSMQLDPCPRMR